MTAAEADRHLLRLRHDHVALGRWWRAAHATPFPGRTEALLALARSLGRPLPPCEYQLPEETLEWLLERVASLRGATVPLVGAPGHKGRVGDGVERLLLGAKVAGRRADHPAAEIKSVPVRGDSVIERVKLGVVSAASNPLLKCARVLFVFVEERGSDVFIAGHRLHEFAAAAWVALWRSRALVETAAGSPEQPTRGLYLVPRWFRQERLWPPGL